MNFNAIAFGAALFGAVVAYKWAESKGVKKEQSRVETVGKKVDAKAQKARVAAVANPDAARLLSKHCRDCGADLPVLVSGDGEQKGPPHKANR